MIQRIQTIYLLLTAFSLSAIQFISIGAFTAENGEWVKVPMNENLPTYLLSIAGVIIALIGIFLYKNRKLQVNIVHLLILIGLLTLASIAFFQFYSDNELVTKPNFLSYPFAVLALIFSFLARKGIQADEKLVRSMDRLR